MESVQPMSLANTPSGAVDFQRGLNGLDWDRALEKQPESGIFHQSVWIQVLKDTYGFEPLRICGSSFEGGPIPSFALMEVNSPITGRRGVALPFTDECPPLCADKAAFSPLFSEALAHGRSRGWKYIESRGGCALADNASPSTSFFGHSLDLTIGEKKLFESTDASVRRAVRKAESSGLTLSTSQTIEDVRIFYGLLCKTRKRHGLPVQPFRFFANIHRHLLDQGKGHTTLAYAGSVPVAGAMFLHHQRQALYKFGASDETFQRLRGNNLVMWNAIRWHSANGYTNLDFGRTSLTNEGLRAFKLSWGTRERRIDYFRYNLGLSRFVTVADGAAGWHNQIFARLPVSLSRLAGALLYKHVG